MGKKLTNVSNLPETLKNALDHKYPLWTTVSEKFLVMNFCVEVFQNFPLGSMGSVKVCEHKF